MSSGSSAVDVDIQGSDMAFSSINGGVAEGVDCAELEIKAGEINALCTCLQRLPQGIIRRGIIRTCRFPSAAGWEQNSFVILLLLL